MLCVCGQINHYNNHNKNKSRIKEVSKCMTQIGDKNKRRGAQSCSRLGCQFCTGRLSALDSLNHRSWWFRMSKGGLSLIVNWFWGGVFTCEGEAITREENDAKGRGPPLFCCVLSCEEVLACPVWERVPVPACRPAGWRGPDSPVFILLSTCCKCGVPLPPLPSPPRIHPSIHPSERWGRVCGPNCWPVRTSFCYL